MPAPRNPSPRRPRAPKRTQPKAAAQRSKRLVQQVAERAPFEPPDDPLKESVEAQFQLAQSSYLVDGGTYTAPPHFRISSGFNGSQSECMSKIAKDLLAANKGKLPAGVKDATIGRVTAGRGSPEEVRAITQALIDAGKLGPTTKTVKRPDHTTETIRIGMALRIQDLQWAYGIGMDCAGYTQQAFMRARGLDPYNAADRTKMGLDAKIGNEGLSPSKLLRGGAFKEVGVERARAGDLLLMKAPQLGDVGHCAIVRHSRVLTDEEAQQMADAPLYGGTARHNLVQFFGQTPVRAIEVDSSWGAGPDGDAMGSGVSRQVVFKNAGGEWARQRPDSTIQITPVGPCNEPYGGTLRPKDEA